MGNSTRKDPVRKLGYMRLLLLDLETSGLDLSKDQILEVGSSIVDYKEGVFNPCSLWSMFIDPNKSRLGQKFSLSPEITKLNGITQRILEEFGEPAENVLSRLRDDINRADFIVAHNGLKFDKPMLESNCRRLNFGLPEKPWIDTCLDVPYPDSMSTRNLKFLLAEHGVINPYPHRALTDALSLIRLLERYPMEEIIESAKSPMVRMEAILTYDTRELARKANFHWEPNTKNWVRYVRQYTLKKLKLPFEVVCRY